MNSGNQSSFLNMHNKWFIERCDEDFFAVSSLKGLEYTGTTKFQKMDVVTLGSFGRCLVLDDETQSSERDEMVYHESLVHPAMLMAKNPERVLIAGGGEGATLREVLRHKSVKEAVMVDIDGECVEACKKHLPQHHAGAFDDPRTTLIIDDAKKIIEESEDESYDVIILDLADPVEGNPCFNLYAKFFYEMCKQKLRKGGVVVTQSGPSGIMTADKVFTPIHATLKQVFKRVNAYSVFVPSFIDNYGFNMALKDDDSEIPPLSEVDPQWIDQRIQESIADPSLLKHYDGITHRRMFNLIKQIRDSLNSEKRVITKDNFVYMH